MSIVVGGATVTTHVIMSLIRDDANYNMQAARYQSLQEM